MSLARFLEGKFRGDIRHRGAAYFKAGRVAITRVTPDHIYAVVRDGVEHQTQLTRNEGELTLYCSSVENSPKPPITKYLWATVLAADEAGYLTGTTIQPGQVPPFIPEVATSRLSIEDWGEDDDDLEYIPTSARRSGKQSPEIAELLGDESRDDGMAEWEKHLVNLREELVHGGFNLPESERETEISYEIDSERSREVGMLVVQTSQRQRRANGQWGKRKALKLRPGQLDGIDSPADRQILAYLFGGTADQDTVAGTPAGRLPSAFRFRLTCELCELILPMICATGRIFLTHDDVTSTKPLAWDENDNSWQLCAKLVEDKTEKAWTLQGELRRDEETLSLEETQLMVPGGLVITETHIARLDDFDSFAWLETLSGKDQFSVPLEEGGELVDRLLDMPVLPRLDLPKDLRLEEVYETPKPTLSVKLPATSNSWRPSNVHGQVEFSYAGHSVRGSSTQWAIVRREEGRCLVRDRAAEKLLWSRLQELGFRRVIDRRQSRFDVDVSANDLGTAVRALIEEDWEVLAEGEKVRQAGEMQFRVESGIDWFELSADVDFGGKTVPFPELLSALVRGDTMIRLSDGSLGVIPEHWKQQYGLLAGLGTMEDEHVRFAPNQVGLLDALLSTQEKVDYDDQFIKWRDRLDSFTGVESAQEPENFNGELREYQREGLGWLNFLHEFRCGGCLADDMGLGKTVQVLALMQEQKKNREVHKPSLIVVPKSLMFNWKQEAERFTENLNVLEYSGTERAAARKTFDKQDLILTTYGTLRRDIVALKEVGFDYVVLDEAQTIKNSGSQVAKASRLLRCDNRLALSGTPIENHIGDLWSIFEFLNPGMLGRSSAFKTLTSDVNNSSARQMLASALKPFVLRRTKQQVARELPDKIEETIVCEMGEKQQKLYDELRDHYRESLLGMVSEKGMGKSKIHVLEALLRLRQAACHPALIAEEHANTGSAKLDALQPMLDEILNEKHKSLVFSQFTSMLAIVRKELDEKGIPYVYLDGKTRNRQEVIEKFQNDPEIGVFLISLKAGGLGLNLTAAEYVFLLDPWWNPAVEAQAIDRAHRVGQTQNVFAYRLICKGTVEEKIAELQGKKRKLADAILQADESLLKSMTKEDLEMLFS